MAELARQADSFLGVSFVLTVVRLPACLLKNQRDVCSPTRLPQDSVFTGAQKLWVAFFELAPKNSAVDQSAHPVRDAYFTLFVDIQPGKVCPFYSIYLTNWEKLPIFVHFYPGRVFYFSVKYSPLH